MLSEIRKSAMHRLIYGRHLYKQKTRSSAHSLIEFKQSNTWRAMCAHDRTGAGPQSGWLGASLFPKGNLIRRSLACVKIKRGTTAFTIYTASIAAASCVLLLLCWRNTARKAYDESTPLLKLLLIIKSANSQLPGAKWYNTPPVQVTTKTTSTQLYRGLQNAHDRL